MLRQRSLGMRDTQLKYRLESYTGVELENGHYIFTIQFVRNADHGHVGDAGHVHERLFDGRRTDVYTTANDEILLTSSDKKRSPMIKMANVTARKPVRRIYF